MTRGHPPVVAIAEAMHYAERIGFSVIGVNAAWLPCDFMAIDDGQITLVRVRRLRYGRCGFRDITRSCKRENLKLHGIPIFDDTGREFWVRARKCLALRYARADISLQSLKTRYYNEKKDFKVHNFL